MTARVQTTGVVQGRSIRFQDDLGFPEGATLDIVVKGSNGSTLILEVKTSGNAPPRPEQDERGRIATWWTEEDDRLFAELAEERRTAVDRELPEGLSG